MPGTLYATNIDSDKLYSIDVTTGAATEIGPTSGWNVNMPGLAYDTSTNTLYGASAQTQRLYEINETSAALSDIGPFSAAGIANLGLTYDANSDLLYLSSTAGSEGLFTVDRGSGNATFVVNITGGNGNIDSLAFDPNTNRLFGVDFSNDTLYTIDTTTGVANPVGSLGVNIGPLGLAFDPTSNTLYAADSGTDRLYHSQ